MNIAGLLKPIGLVVALSLFGSSAWSATLTGDPSTPSVGTYPAGQLPWSTNLANYLSGDFHHVLLVSSDVGEVTLKFVNPEPYNVNFETRLDGVVLLAGTPHALMAGDFTYPNYTLAGLTEIIMTFTVNGYIEIRSALGPERDGDFDWTRFDAIPVPLPGALLLFGSALAGFFGFSKLRKRLSTHEPAAA